MHVSSRVRAAASICWSFLKGIFSYARYFVRKKEVELYCILCIESKRPLARGRYMIRTCQHREIEGEHPAPVFEFYVCIRHHPDKHVLDAEWAHETQDFLRKRGAAAQCVYLHFGNRHSL